MNPPHPNLSPVSAHPAAGVYHMTIRPQVWFDQWTCSRPGSDSEEPGEEQADLPTRCAGRYLFIQDPHTAHC